MEKPEQRPPLLSLRDARRRPPRTMSGESTFVLDSTVSPARSFALSFDPGAFDTLMDTQALLKETFGLAMPEARGSPHAEEERRADPPTAVEEEDEDEDEDDDGLVPYERERLERMHRNDEVMRRLGIAESVNKLEGKAAPPPEKNPVIIIDDDEDDEAKNDTEEEDEEEEENDDETGGIYGCKRCRFSRKGCYDSADGKLRGCHPDAHLGPLYLQGLPKRVDMPADAPKRVSVPVDAPKKKRKVVYEHEVPPILSPRTKRPRLVLAKLKAPKTERTCTVVPSPKHTSSPNDKNRYTTVPGYSGVRVSSTSGRFNVTISGKPDRLYLGTVDTLREAVELYNKEAKKRGKPIKPLHDDKLDVPEVNKQSTVVPGLKGINMMTVDGKFMAQVYKTGKPFKLVTTTLLMRR